MRNAAILRVQQRSEEHDKQKKEEKRERDQYALKEQMRVCATLLMFAAKNKIRNWLCTHIFRHDKTTVQYFTLHSKNHDFVHGHQNFCSKLFFVVLVSISMFLFLPRKIPVQQAKLAG